MRIGKNTPWLVKSSGRIIGPFYENEIMSLLRTREIVLIDELSRPCGRWVYIRDEPAFAQIAEELRQKNLKTLNDETTAQIEQTQTPTATISVTDKLIDDRTEEISNIIEINSQNIQDIKDILQTPAIKKSVPAASDTYVFAGDHRVQAEVHEKTKWLWAVAVIVIFSAIGYVAFRQYISKPIQEKTVALANLTRAFELFQQGANEEALALFKKANEVYPDDQRAYLPLSILLIQLENQTVQARRLLEVLLSHQEQDRHKVLVASGLADLAEQKFSEAETRFNRALEIDPLFKPALINLGVASLLSGDIEKANNHLQIAIKDGSRTGLEQILAADVLTQIYEKEKDKSYLLQAEKFLNDYLSPLKPFYQEALISLIYIHYLSGENNKIYEKINLFLNADPLNTDLHTSHIYNYKDQNMWQRLNQWCLKSTAQLDPTSHVVAFEALCLLKNNDLTEASRKIEDAIQQTPRDSLVQAAYGFILESLNALDRAQSAFEKAVDFDREKKYETPRLNIARYCEATNQIDCSFKYYNELLQINSNSLPALAGLYRLSLQSGKTSESQKYLQKGMQLSSTYKPFLKLNRVGP